MAEVALAPGVPNVYTRDTGGTVFSNDGPAKWNYSQVVGTDPWKDDDDASWVGVASGNLPNPEEEVANDFAEASIVIPEEIDAAQVSDLGAKVRISAFDSTTEADSSQLHLLIGQYGQDASYVGIFTIPPVSGGTVDLTFRYSDSMSGQALTDAMAPIIAALNTPGVKMFLITPGGYTSGGVDDPSAAKIYEAEVFIDTTQQFSEGGGPVGAEGSSTTDLILNGPGDPENLGDTHMGAFKIWPLNRPKTISFSAHFSSPDECWVEIFGIWAVDRGQGVLDRISDSRLTPRVRVGDVEVDVHKWEQIQVYSEVPLSEATHWRPWIRMYSEVDKDTPLLDGHQVFIDAIYIPDNGKPLTEQPYLDGDQSYGIWEGEPRRSTSIFGEKGASGAVLAENVVIPGEIEL